MARTCYHWKKKKNKGFRSSDRTTAYVRRSRSVLLRLSLLLPICVHCKVAPYISSTGSIVKDNTNLAEQGNGIVYSRYQQRVEYEYYRSYECSFTYARWSGYNLFLFSPLSFSSSYFRLSFSFSLCTHLHCTVIHTLYRIRMLVHQSIT